MPDRAQHKRDLRWMARALELATRGVGRTRPNPPVGAIITKGNRLLSEGWHRAAGTPHAEAIALSRAGVRARQATLYVTLEPCCSQGRTPPCTEAIIRAGIRRVVVATTDPDPRHRGRGLRVLRRAGIEVVTGPGGEEARRLLRPFATRLTQQRPWLILKLAVTLDGRVADADGQSRWISGPAARRLVTQWRRESDAVLVGSRTAILDDPSLLPHTRGRATAYRVVADSRGSLPRNAQLLRDAHAAQTILATTPACPQSTQRAYAQHGAQVWQLPPCKGHVSMRRLMRRLADEGVMQVLCEGGGVLAGTLLAQRLVDELRIFVAPRILGDQAAPAIAGQDWPLRIAPAFDIEHTRQIGKDVLISALRKDASHVHRTR